MKLGIKILNFKKYFNMFKNYNTYKMVGISYSIMDIMIENVLTSFSSKSTGRLHYVHSNILVHPVWSKRF